MSTSDVSLVQALRLMSDTHAFAGDSIAANIAATAADRLEKLASVEQMLLDLVAELDETPPFVCAHVVKNQGVFLAAEEMVKRRL